jgi:hypothetical protein
VRSYAPAGQFIADKTRQRKVLSSTAILLAVVQDSAVHYAA